MANLVLFFPRLHLLTSYIPGSPNSKEGDYVVFVFDNLIFQLYRKFLAAEEIGSDQNEDYQLYFKTNETDFQIKQLSNCLFVPDDKCNPDPVKFYPNFDYPSIIFWSSLVLFLMVLFVTCMFVTGLLLVKFGKFGKFGKLCKFNRKKVETKLVESNLVGKSKDSILCELKKDVSTKSIASLSKKRNGSQLSVFQSIISLFNSRNGSQSSSSKPSMSKSDKSIVPVNRIESKSSSKQNKTSKPNEKSIKKKG